MPTDELERELRRALASAAAGYQQPEQACQRLLQHNYRPGSGHRRLTAGITAAAAAGSVALGLGLSGGLGSSPPPGTGTIRTAAFTITRNANGTATLTINPRVLFDPGTLQSDLAQYGIPGQGHHRQLLLQRSCPQRLLAGRHVLPGIPGRQRPAAGTGTRPSRSTPPPCPPEPSSASAPSRSPAEDDTALALIDTNSYTCTSTAPTTPPSSGALLHWNGAAGS